MAHSHWQPFSFGPSYHYPNWFSRIFHLRLHLHSFLIPPAAPKDADQTCKPQGASREVAGHCSHIANFSLHGLFLTSDVFGD